MHKLLFLFVLSIIFIKQTHAAKTPSILYHFGSYEHLSKNIAQHTVPEDVWNKYIMGETTRYKQKSFRRGLYGTSHPIDSAFYGDIMVGKGDIPWFVEIHINKTCLKQASLANIEKLPENLKFKKWFQKLPEGTFKYNTIQEFTSSCYTYYEYLPPPLNKKRFASGFETQTSDELENECEIITNTFFIEEDVKIVFDHASKNSWYIRDRSCIKDIKGTNRDILHLMSTLPNFWKFHDGNVAIRPTAEPLPGGSIFIILLYSLLQCDDVINYNLIDSLINSIRKANYFYDKNSNAMYPSVPEEQVDYWLKDSVLPILRAYVNCEGKIKEINLLLNNFIIESRKEHAQETKNFRFMIDVLVKETKILCP